MEVEEQTEGAALEVAFRFEETGRLSQASSGPQVVSASLNVFLISTDLYIFWRGNHIAPLATPFHSSVALPRSIPGTKSFLPLRWVH